MRPARARDPRGTTCPARMCDMLIGVPKESKPEEFRVALTPGAALEYISRGHPIVVETQAGSGIGAGDDDYRKVGATILNSIQDVFASADMIVKVKEPQLDECELLRKNQILFTFLHLAADRRLTETLVRTGCTAVAYETVTGECGELPLLAPMSEVAGRMAIEAGAIALRMQNGGKGILLGGVPGVAAAKVVVLGGGVVGTQAARMAVGLGSQVTIIDRSLTRLRRLDEMFNGRVTTLYSTIESIEQAVTAADVVIGAVLVPGASAPKLVSRAMLRRMSPGAVMVDVAIDQGGCFETSLPTSHHAPTYAVDEIIHYCVTNMPGAVPRTSSQALVNATLPFGLLIAEKGLDAFRENKHLRNGLNIHRRFVTHPAVAQSLGLPYCEPEAALRAAAG
jgi:alanine dehydrogenase